MESIAMQRVQAPVCASQRRSSTKSATFVAPLALRTPGVKLRQTCGPAPRHTATSRRGSLAPRATADVAEEVTIDNCTVLVVGEEGVGMEVVRCLAKAGSWVTAYHTGEGHRKEIEGLGAMLAVGEASAADKVGKTLRGNTFDAVVYSISTDSPPSMGSLDAQLNVIIAAREAKIPRFLLVSSAGAEDEETLESVQRNLAEGGADMKWTVIRTGPVVQAPRSSATPSLVDGAEVPKGSVSASDLAFLISQVLFDADFANKALSAVNLEQ